VLGGICGLVLAGRRVGLSLRTGVLESCLPAVGRALLVAASLGVVRLSAGSGLPAMSVALAAASVVGLGVLWQSNWPELQAVKRRARGRAPS